MSLPSSQLRVIEDKYADFYDFIGEGKFDEARAVIESMKEFYALDVDGMHRELEAAQLAQ